MLGVETFEVEDEETKGGASGEVEAFAHVKLEYPCIVVSPPFEKYKIKVLSVMFASVGDLDEVINLYFSSDNRMVSYGHIGMKQINSFLKLFEGNELVGYLDESTCIKGDKLYCLGVLQ